MRNICTIILAAGKGSRMNSFTPKILHKIGGLPIINHVTNTAITLKSKQIVIVLNDLTSITKYARKKIPAAKIIIQKEQKGTAHALLSTKKYLKKYKGIILILFADIPLISSDTLKKLIFSCQQGSDIAVLGMQKKNPEYYGRLIMGSNNNLKRIVEYKDATIQERKISLCNAGIMAFNSETMFYLLQEINNKNKNNEFYLTDTISVAEKKGLKISLVKTSSDEAQGINHKHDLAKIENIFQTIKRKNALSYGVTLIDPKSIHFSHDTYLGQDTLIHPNVIFKNGVYVDNGAEIREFSSIEGSYIGTNSIIGPFARLRPGTNIKKNVKVGNFVELKKSFIEEDSKINHLSYIGNTKVGKQSNIGAGTITCNYDGFNKWPTKIKNNVFIGSNTTLIAPINIGDDVIIAANSTITNNIPNESISLTRTKQIIHKNNFNVLHNKK